MKDKGMIYVAGPYTQGDPVENTHNVIKAGVLLREAGYCPVLPHLSLLTHIVSPHDATFWYEWDLGLLARCDFMLRLPGDSWGADQEELFAKGLGLAVHKMTAEEFVERFE